MTHTNDTGTAVLNAALHLRDECDRLGGMQMSFAFKEQPIVVMWSSDRRTATVMAAGKPAVHIPEDELDAERFLVVENGTKDGPR